MSTQATQYAKAICLTPAGKDLFVAVTLPNHPVAEGIEVGDIGFVEYEAVHKHPDDVAALIYLTPVEVSNLRKQLQPQGGGVGETRVAAAERKKLTGEMAKDTTAPAKDTTAPAKDTTAPTPTKRRSTKKRTTKKITVQKP